MSLRIGSPAGDLRRRFDLPEDLVTLTTAVVGIRGSGKTVTAAVIAEELLERGHQVVIIDPTDVWWGLKSSADGTAEGFPVVVMGGPHGDLPLKADSGRVLADFAVERRVPMVLSLRHLRKGKQRTFVTDFAEQLYHRKGEAAHRTPVLVIVDEASAFIPQRVGGGEARMVGAIEDLVRRGRAAGIGFCAVDQRPASINKDVLTQIEVLVSHRISSPQDRKALDEWIKQHDTRAGRGLFLEELASLDTGEAWFWSPSLDVFDPVQVRMRDTYDSSQTPKRGEQLRAPEKVADIDLDALREQLQETIAEAEANDPKALRARIEELERELRSARNAEPAPAVDEEAIRSRIHDELREEFTDQLREHLGDALAAGIGLATKRLRATLNGTGEYIRVIGEAAGMLATTLDEDLPEALADLEDDPPMPEDLRIGGFAPLPRTPQSSRPRPRTSKAPAQTVKAPPSDVVEEISPRHQRILDALRRLEAMGIGAPSRSVLAAVARYSPKSSGYEKAVSRLSSLDLVNYPGPGDVALTATGRGVAAAPAGVVTLEELHAAWFRILEPRHVRILEPLIAIYPRALSREELAERSDYSPLSSGYEKAISRLSSFGLVHYPQPGHVAATELLFPEELR